MQDASFRFLPISRFQDPWGPAHIQASNLRIPVPIMVLAISTTPVMLRLPPVSLSSSKNGLKVRPPPPELGLDRVDRLECLVRVDRG